MSAILNDPQYAGILLALQPSTIDDSGAPSPFAPAQDEIDDDIDGEKETLDLEELTGAPDNSESDEGSGEEDEDGDSKMADLTAMCAVITKASKGVVDSTDAEYKRNIKLCEKFVHLKGFIKEEEAFFTNNPHPDAAAFIVAWILDR
ncbi:hypothetical protein B0H13DRAFT_1878510 [Mycena leptocephala]|nr:hypothetical protein B0H13DRAFT_1878510 [Mycena leptocephala]